MNHSPNDIPPTDAGMLHRYWHPDDGVRRVHGLVDVRTASQLSRIGVSTLYRWVHTGRLRRCVVSRRPLRFDWDRLIDELSDRHWRW